MDISNDTLLAQLDFMDEEDVSQQLFLPIRGFLSKNIHQNWANDILSSIGKKRYLNGGELFAVCEKFYLNKEILKAFYESHTAREKTVIERATWSGMVSYQDVNKLYGKQIFRAEKSTRNVYGNSFTLSWDQSIAKLEPFIVFRQVWHASSADNYILQCSPRISFPAFLRIVYSRLLPKPKGYYLKGIRPKKESLSFNAENDIFRELPLITTFLLQGNARYTQKGYPVTATAKKMGKTLQLRDFPTEDETGLRALMIAGLFTEDFDTGSFSKPPLKLLDKLFKQDFSLYPTYPYLLDHLKGIKNFYPGEFRHQVTLQILEIFKAMNTRDWIAFDNIRSYATYHFINLMPISIYELDKLRFKDEKSGPHYLTPETANEYLAIPTLAAHIYLLAAFGLMELSLDPDASVTYSPYDRLSACRLTPLGAFLFGLTKDYTPARHQNKTKLLFDENSLIIRMEGNIALGDAMLTNYAIKVSENRYQFSPGKFLKDCRSSKDLVNKIVLFKKTISQKLPPFWERYLSGLVENTKAITLQKDIHIFKLPPKDAELHRLIAQDNVLRSFIVKAEKFQVLIQERHLTNFINRMKELGYLIS